MLVCTECGKELDESEFYVHSDTGNYYGRCKKCHTKKSNSYRNPQPYPHEIKIAEKLKAVGVPVIHGRQFSDKAYKSQDLIAYGIYKIECKPLKSENRIWLTKKQMKRNYADYFIIISDEDLLLVPYNELLLAGAKDQRVYHIGKDWHDLYKKSPEDIKSILLKKLVQKREFIHDKDNI